MHKEEELDIGYVDAREKRTDPAEKRRRDNKKRKRKTESRTKRKSKAKERKKVNRELKVLDGLSFHDPSEAEDLCDMDLLYAEKDD